MADTIRLSYEDMRAVATDVVHQAEQARQVIDILERDVARLLPTWAGASKEAFETMFNLWRKELVLVPEMLDQVGLALRQTADRIQQAEQESVTDMAATVTADD
jgi:WXG100 family type VII secretion target